jgi:protein-S-isoprenylcysteine O-methyltransferase Ste14
MSVGDARGADALADDRQGTAAAASSPAGGAPVGPVRVKTDETAGVVSFPPLIVGVPLVVGLALQSVIPLAPLQAEFRPFGVAALAAGLVLIAWTVRVMRAHRTQVNPFLPTSELVTDGPFRWSRNPIYLGFCLAYLGAGFALRASWVILFFPLVAAVLDVGVIRREERYLRRLFGTAYEAYRGKVRRWI